MIKEFFKRLFHRHQWEYSHIDDPAYPDMPESFNNFRTCKDSECGKEHQLDYDGWCEIMSNDEYRTKNDPLYAHIKKLNNEDPK